MRELDAHFAVPRLLGHERAKESAIGNSGMNHKRPGQTTSGGEAMEQEEITLGQVTYPVSRIYDGSRPASELVAERLARWLSENPPFGEGHSDAV